MKITPYLMFNGEAAAAVEFYAEVFGGTPGNVYRYADFPPMPDQPPLSEEMLRRVGHACVSFPGGTMGLADTALPERLTFGSGHMLTVVVDTVEEARGVWERLSAGAQKVMCPLQPTFYAKIYGELTDRFGVLWAVMTGE